MINYQVKWWYLLLKKKRKQDRKDREQWGLAGMGLGMDYTFMLVKRGRSQ